jgi:hypothetical protein
MRAGFARAPILRIFFRYIEQPYGAQFVRSLQRFGGQCGFAAVYCVTLKLDASAIVVARAMSGRSAAWLARLVRDQEVEGSNPFAPTTFTLFSSGY